MRITIRMSGLRAGSLAISLLVLAGTPAASQEQGPGGVAWADRAAMLYVGDSIDEHPRGDYQSNIEDKARTDSIFEAVTAGVMDFRKTRYPSSIGDMDIPAYVYEPLEKGGPRGHAALIWVHGGVHDNWTTSYWPFVKEAVERGYVVVAPDYRGSTGYGEEFHNAIDYGGYEVDDVMSAYDYIVTTMPYVDPDRIAVMGWSHGGYISLLSVFRDDHPFAAAAAIVPVTNLIFRLSYKGPVYQRNFATQSRIGGLPFEQREKYVERSPYYHVDELEVPLLVHVATNDADVTFEESSMLIWALRSQKADLAETMIYENPDPWGDSGGHEFSRRVDKVTLERVDSPAQIDSWNRTWTFLEKHLRPEEGSGGADSSLRSE